MLIVLYRALYALVVLVFFGNFVQRTRMTGSGPILLIADCLLLGLVLLVVAFRRVPVSVFWIAVCLWEAIFIWFGWFASEPLFKMRELHTFNAAAIASETRVHYFGAIALFIVLCAWFLSLPFVRRAE